MSKGAGNIRTSCFCPSSPGARPGVGLWSMTSAASSLSWDSTSPSPQTSCSQRRTVSRFCSLLISLNLSLALQPKYLVDWPLDLNPVLVLDRRVSLAHRIRSFRRATNLALMVGAYTAVGAGTAHVRVIIRGGRGRREGRAAWQREWRRRGRGRRPCRGLGGRGFLTAPFASPRPA